MIDTVEQTIYLGLFTMMMLVVSIVSSPVLVVLVGVLTVCLIVFLSEVLFV